MDNFRDIKYQAFKEDSDEEHENEPINNSVKYSIDLTSEKAPESLNSSLVDENNNSKNNIFSSSQYYKKNPIIRKLKIINSNPNPNVRETSFRQNEPVGYSSTIDLYRSNPFNVEKPREKKYYDPNTNMSFNNMNEFNELTEKLRLEVDDSKNILKSNIEKMDERETIIEEMVEKSTNLSENSDRFYRTSRRLKNKICIQYGCHILGMSSVIVFIIVLVSILTNE